MTKKSATPEFANALKVARMKTNWSLRDVEKRTGRALSRQTVLRAENGDVSLETLLKLLDLYGINSKDERRKVIDSFNEHQLASVRAA